MAYTLKPVDDTFFDDAPLVVPATVQLHATPAQVWEALSSDAMWSWAPIIDQVTWITPRPHAAGAIRRLRLLKLDTIEEEFYRWDEGRRATFRVVAQSRQMLEGLAEDFLLEPLDGGAGTRLTWTMAIALRGVPAPPKALLPVLVRGNAAAIGGIRKILPPRG
ncbi:MAG TPA: SRPBCC family protein [Baekduia sp.]|nr:SRPBCC family protein [Baekduia sp.]